MSRCSVCCRTAEYWPSSVAKSLSCPCRRNTLRALWKWGIQLDWDYMPPCLALQVGNHSNVMPMFTEAPSAPKEMHFSIHDPPSSSWQTEGNAALVASETPRKTTQKILYKSISDKFYSSLRIMIKLYTRHTILKCLVGLLTVMDVYNVNFSFIFSSKFG